MPELPEVETVVRSLRPHITGRRIEDCRVGAAKLIRRPVGNVEAFSRALCGRTITGVGRRAKYIVISLDQGWLLVHLGMTGKLVCRPQGTEPVKHDHVRMRLDDGSLLIYNDVRRFGGLGYWSTDPYLQTPLAELGPEPLGPDFSGQILYEAAKQTRRPVKSLLLDQHVVAGLGNIYADEVLFAAGVRPRRGAWRLTHADCDRLAVAAKDILAEAIRCGGSTIRDYVDADQRPGAFQFHHQVYGREGQPCSKCGTVLKKVVVGGRSSVYCPHCQK